MTPPATVGARITARGWGWRHASRRAPAVQALDLSIEPGERVLLLGRSGAGKSTLIQALAGVLGGNEEGDAFGELLIDGHPPQSARGEAGLVLQDPDSQVVLARVGDDVAFACENLGIPRDEIWRRVPAALAEVGLDLPLGHTTAHLSGGQKQRLALAGIVAMRPRLLLLDEPTANLDPDGVIEVRDAVARTQQSSGATLIVIEHRVSIWLDVVDRVIVLDPDGGLLADGTPHDVLQRAGSELAAAGVWVPGFPPSRPERQARSVGQPLLAASDLAVGRTEFARRTPTIVNSGIDLEIAAGESVVIVGDNGAGKSTLALTLAGLLPPAGGAVEARAALARGLGAQPHRWRSKQLLTRLGMVFQDPEHQFLAATVRAELEVGPRALGEGVERVELLLERLHLGHLANANPFTLSGGEKRRLSVATALATRPQLLLLDEPTFGQDALTWEQLVALLAELIDDGTALISVTHDRDYIEAIADRSLVLESRVTA
ncbi:ABC transporter ATP-binding protein [Lacisediminihabitans changchengi]|uniref:ABC transporter ATP-binding protein n=1 Tax=Lacisediminihabitans changchengi TaxID=2787634 RepID=UPI0027DD359D|nr:ATP-binding cassette domain-containing protein [Lacisediminihabitans changchengi]